uniref:HNH endonuclease n=1 Tax=Anaerolinea thermolimosa TaxID=229919 RepID=A0A7C4PKX2_9CHLR
MSQTGCGRRRTFEPVFETLERSELEPGSGTGPRSRGREGLPPVPPYLAAGRPVRRRRARRQQVELAPEDPLRRMDDAHAQAGAAFLQILHLICELERTRRWKAEGARDTAHLLCMRYGISAWKAHRMVDAAHALPRLPRLSEALEHGLLGPDKVLELARYATPATEQDLIGWARRVSVTTVRRRGELQERALREQAERLQRERRCTFYLSDGGRRFHLEAELPAAEGARIAAAIEQVASAIPVMPGEEDARYAAARRADALVALCTYGAAGGSSGAAGGEGAGGKDPGTTLLLPRVRATVVLHARVGAQHRLAELEAGGICHPTSAERVSCTGVVEHVHEDRFGRLLSRISQRRTPPSWMVRQVRYRDGGCTFPGCGTRAYTEAHHIRFHRFGGKTTMENLTLLCSFHHRLVHEHGWKIRREASGELSWYRPDGRRHSPGPVLRGADVDGVPELEVFGPFEAEQARDGPDP